MAWKALSRSATGISHQIKGIPCQDYGNYQILDRDIIIGAVSDGMGSAKHSDIGSELTVKTTLSFLEKRIESKYKKDKQYSQKPISEREANNIFRNTLDEVFDKLSEVSSDNWTVGSS